MHDTARSGWWAARRVAGKGSGGPRGKTRDYDITEDLSGVGGETIRFRTCTDEDIAKEITLILASCAPPFEGGEREREGKGGRGGGCDLQAPTQVAGLRVKGAKGERKRRERACGWLIQS